MISKFNSIQAEVYTNLNDAFKAQRANTCNKKLVLNFFGDVYVDESKIAENHRLFDKIQNILNVGNANIINLEGPITHHTIREFPDQTFALKNASWLPKKLVQSGIKHVTLANNHIMDFGSTGLNDTLNVLKKNNIHFGGAGSSLSDALKPIMIHMNGIKVSVISFATTLPSGSWATENRPGIAFATNALLKETIQKESLTSDFIIVSFHWGKEGSRLLRPHQKDLAHYAVEMGANLVLGHHAHVAQEIELFKEVPIFYGLGNFVFSSVTPTPVLSLGIHIMLCKNREKNKNKILWAISPLNTLNLNSKTRYQTRVHSPEDFFPLALTYVESGLWKIPMPIVLDLPVSLESYSNIWQSPLAALK